MFKHTIQANRLYNILGIQFQNDTFLIIFN